MQNEQILVVPTELLKLPRSNYISDPNLIRELLTVCASNYRFMSRKEAENDPSCKQLIPYITIVNQASVLCLERTTAQGEARLHGKISLGAGGHINPVDKDNTLDDIIARAMARELREELWLDPADLPTLKGLINDDSNPVGTVHLGLHYILQVNTRPRVRETDKMKASWLEVSQLEALRPRMETWSQILLPALAIADPL